MYCLVFWHFSLSPPKNLYLASNRKVALLPFDEAPVHTADQISYFNYLKYHYHHYRHIADILAFGSAFIGCIPGVTSKCFTWCTPPLAVSVCISL